MKIHWRTSDSKRVEIRRGLMQTMRTHFLKIEIDVVMWKKRKRITKQPSCIYCTHLSPKFSKNQGSFGVPIKKLTYIKKLNYNNKKITPGHIWKNKNQTLTYILHKPLNI
jgi:hypothetical protein